MVLMETIVSLHLQLSLFAVFLQINPLLNEESREQNPDPDPSVHLSLGIR
jgi:hypothetical protein